MTNEARNPIEIEQCIERRAIDRAMSDIDIRLRAFEEVVRALRAKSGSSSELAERVEAAHEVIGASHCRWQELDGEIAC